MKTCSQDTVLKQMRNRCAPWGIKKRKEDNERRFCIYPVKGPNRYPRDISDQQFKLIPDFIHNSLHAWLQDNARYVTPELDDATYERFATTVSNLTDPVDKSVTFTPDATQQILQEISGKSMNTDVIALCGDRNIYQKIAIVRFF